MSSNIIVRRMKYDDLDAVVQIDADILGFLRKNYYKNKFEKGMEPNSNLCSLVALENNSVVGFIMGTMYFGEYGFDENSAIIDTIGVSPRYQGFGIAALLYKEFIETISKFDIKKIYTIVDWEDLSLIKFFNSEGFVPSKRLCLEMEI